MRAEKGSLPFDLRCPHQVISDTSIWPQCLQWEEAPLILEGAVLFLLCLLISGAEFLTHCTGLPILCFKIVILKSVSPRASTRLPFFLVIKSFVRCNPKHIVHYDKSTTSLTSSTTLPILQFTPLFPADMIWRGASRTVVAPAGEWNSYLTVGFHESLFSESECVHEGENLFRGLLM